MRMTSLTTLLIALTATGCTTMPRPIVDVAAGYGTPASDTCATPVAVAQTKAAPSKLVACLSVADAKTGALISDMRAIVLTDGTPSPFQNITRQDYLKAITVSTGAGGEQVQYETETLDYGSASTITGNPNGAKAEVTIAGDPTITAFQTPNGTLQQAHTTRQVVNVIAAADGKPVSSTMDGLTATLRISPLVETASTWAKP